MILFLNVVSPTIYASLLAYANFYFYNNPGAHVVSRNFTIAYLTSKYSIGLEQLFSGVIVILAVIMIRKFLIKNALENQVNYQKLAAHGIIFAFYIVSIVVFYYFYYIYTISTSLDAKRECLIAWIVTTYMNFLVQLAMIAIFLQLKTNEHYLKEVK